MEDLDFEFQPPHLSQVTPAYDRKKKVKQVTSTSLTTHIDANKTLSLGGKGYLSLQTGTNKSKR